MNVLFYLNLFIKNKIVQETAFDISCMTHLCLFNSFEYLFIPLKSRLHNTKKTWTLKKYLSTILDNGEK